MYRKITDLKWWRVFTSVYVSQYGSYKGCAPLGTHHDIERSVLLPVLEPNQKFPTTHPLLSLCDGVASDAVHHQFTPEFILAG